MSQIEAVEVGGQDILDYLSRTDKWFLGGGGATIWSAGFPLFLDYPGFWDLGYYLGYRLQPIYTMTFLDEDLQPLALKVESRRWRPSELTTNYKAGELSFRERKVVLANDSFVSVIEIDNEGEDDKKLELVLWTCQRMDETGKIIDPNIEDERLTFEQESKRSSAPTPINLFYALGIDLPLTSYSINISEIPAGVSPNYPFWHLTPFYEKITGDRLKDEIKTSSLDMHRANFMYMGLHYEIEVPAKSPFSFTSSCSISTDREEARKNLDDTLQGDPVQISIDKWHNFFSNVPHFGCSDPYIQKYYWYRWYGLKLNSINVKKFNLEYPCVFEGPNEDWFRNHISYSAQCHMLEARWMHNPDLAQGSILNFIENQLDNGYIPGGVGAHYNTPNMYHANWGYGVLELDKVHPDLEFLRKVYEPLKLYMEYFDTERDKENSSLYDVVDQGETGQEYMSRYLFVDEKADEWGPIQLKGIDATVYMYELQRSLAEMARQLGKKDEAEVWDERAKTTKEAILTKMWDGERNIFCDVAPKTWEKSPYKAAVCFYPFMTDLASEVHLSAIRKHLLNPDEFWTEWPVPSTSIDDPYFSSWAEWKDKRHDCPWNGRVWPMTNSHVAEALARASLSLDPALRSKAAELIRKFIKMMFYDQNIERPNCYEHYNPFNGKACTYRGVNDYQHSWVVDLIIKYVAGLQPLTNNKFRVEPLPFELDNFCLDKVRYNGHWVKVTWDKEEGLKVYIDSELRGESKKLGRLELEL